jgi:serine/threonine-protein kinase HipA
LAHVCGLNVADSKLVTVGGKDVLMVRRFDRDKTDKGYLRHRMVSALTLLKSEDIPAIKKDWSYLLLADEIRRASTSPEADLRELYKRMCFNAMVSNLDDHPRNHALLAKNEGWRLSPAYDLTPTVSIAQDSRLLAMECGTLGRVANKKNLLTACNRFLLTEEQARLIIGEMVQTIRADWDACLRRAGASAADCNSVSGARLYDGFFYDSEE